MFTSSTITIILIKIINLPRQIKITPDNYIQYDNVSLFLVLVLENDISELDVSAAGIQDTETKDSS